MVVKEEMVVVGGGQGKASKEQIAKQGEAQGARCQERRNAARSTAIRAERAPTFSNP
jgi:hypothetical protein